MNCVKLSSVAFCVLTLLFASTSFAQSRVCDGVIDDETILADIEVLRGMNCIINDSRIKGSIIGDAANTILIYQTKVDNKIIIDGTTTVAISDVIVDDGNIAVSNSEIASLVDSRANDGNIRVTNNRQAYVIQNDTDGRIVCRGNTFLEEGYNNAGKNADQCGP